MSNRGWSYYRTTRRLSLHHGHWWLAVYTGRHFGWKIQVEWPALFIDMPRLAIVFMRTADRG